MTPGVYNYIQLLHSLVKACAKPPSVFIPKQHLGTPWWPSCSMLMEEPQGRRQCVFRIAATQSLGESGLGTGCVLQVHTCCTADGRAMDLTCWFNAVQPSHWWAKRWLQTASAHCVYPSGKIVRLGCTQPSSNLKRASHWAGMESSEPSHKLDISEPT